MPSPSGQKLDDGFSTIVTFSLNTTLSLWEIEVTPPGWDGGDPNPTTTMRNTSLRTMIPKKLKTMTPMDCLMQYDEGAFLVIGDMINKNQQLTLTFPTGRPWTFWGYLRSFLPQRNIEGDRPTARVVLQPTNQNNSNVETNPTVGTTTSSTSTTTTTP